MVVGGNSPTVVLTLLQLYLLRSQSCSSHPNPLAIAIVTLYSQPSIMSSNTGASSSLNAGSTSSHPAALRGSSPFVHAGSPQAGLVPSITCLMENATMVNGGKTFCLIGESSVRFACWAPIIAAGNVLDLVCMVPSPYRDILSDILRVAQKARQQHAGMVSQLSGLENHKRARTTLS